MMINDLIDRELLETVEVELDTRRIDIVKKIGELSKIGRGRAAHIPISTGGPNNLSAC
jgi:hypothetical protein